MISDEIKGKISERLGISYTDLEAAITAEDNQDIALSEVHVFSDEKLDELKGNVKKAAIEVEVKNFKNKHGLDFAGKSIDGLANHMKSVGVKAGNVEPEKRYKELETQFLGIQGEKEALQNKLDSKDNEMFNYQAATSVKGALDFETKIPKDDVFTIFSASHDFVKGEDGTIQVKKKGASDVIKNSTLSPLKADEVFKAFADNYKATSSIKPPKGVHKDGDAITFESNSEYQAYKEANNLTQEQSDKILNDSLAKSGNDFYNE